jgi:hypothetical protein
MNAIGALFIPALLFVFFAWVLLLAEDFLVGLFAQVKRMVSPSKGDNDAG